MPDHDFAVRSDSHGEASLPESRSQARAADASYHRDKVQIRELIESWVVWRDTGDWERLRTVWHPGGLMSASWRDGTAEEFVAANRAGWDEGLDILHQLGGSFITISDCGTRAISQTKMVISQRAKVHGVLCDVHAQARHFDFWEKRQGRWGLLERRTIFDRDRIDVVIPGETVILDREQLERLPSNYRFLGYLQSSLGYPVGDDIPRLRSEAADALYARGREWLARGGDGGRADTNAAARS